MEEGHHQRGFTETVRRNPWILATLVLGILLLVFLVANYTGITGSALSEKQAGDKMLAFVQAQTGGQGSIAGVSSFGNNFYEVNVSIQGQEVPVYMTKDGKYFVPSLTPLEVFVPSDSGNTASENIPKSDKPEVELFIWSYCPYGVQAQGPLAEVVKLLGTSADFKTVLYYDGHGAFETQQNKIQECLQELYPEKYWNYASRFVAEIYPNCSSSRAIECDKSESVKLMKSLGIDSTKVLSCVDSRGANLLSESSSLASQLGVTGSPTLVVNGVKTSTARTAEAYKTAVCEAYTNPPAECQEVLSSTSGTAQGNC